MKNIGEERESLNSIWLKYSFNSDCRNGNLPLNIEMQGVPTPLEIQWESQVLLLSLFFLTWTWDEPSLTRKGPELASQIPRGFSSTQHHFWEWFLSVSARTAQQHRQQRYWSLSSLAQVSEGALEKAAPFNYRAADPFTLPWLPAAVHLCDSLCDTSGVTVRGRGRCKKLTSHFLTPKHRAYLFFFPTHPSCSRCPLGFHMFHQSTLIFYSTHESTGWQAHDPCPRILQPEEAS